MRNRWVWVLAGVLLGALFLAVALRDTPVIAVRDALAAARIPWLFATVIAGVLFMLLKAWRWILLLRRTGRVTAGVAHRAVWAGAALNLVIAHSGELLRAGLAARRSGLAVSALLSSIAIERVLDFAALALLSGLAILMDASVRQALGPVGLVGLAVVLTAVPVGLLVLRGSDAPTEPHGWWQRQLAQARQGLQALRDPLGLAQVLLVSLLQWACIVIAIGCAARAVGVPVSPAGALAAFGLMVLGLTLPSAPAQLGTTQLAFVAGFALVGIATTAALAASFVYTACVVLPALLIGAAMALRGDVGSSASAVPPGTAAAASASEPPPAARSGR